MWSKVSSQFWHHQASTGGGWLEGEWEAQEHPSPFCGPLFYPSIFLSHILWLSQHAGFDDLLSASREGSMLGLQPDIPGPIIWPPPALVSSCIKCSNSRLGIRMRVLWRSLEMLHIIFIVLTKFSFTDSPKVRCSLIWWVRTSGTCYQSTEFPPFMQSGLSDLWPEQLEWSVCSIDYMNMEL